MHIHIVQRCSHKQSLLGRSWYNHLGKTLILANEIRVHDPAHVQQETHHEMRRAVPPDVCSQVTPVKRIYLLNVVVKQESLIKKIRKTKQATSCRVICNTVPFVTRYCIFIHVLRTHWYNTQKKITPTIWRYRQLSRLQLRPAVVQIVIRR